MFARLFLCPCTENLHFSYDAIRKLYVVRRSQKAKMCVVPILYTLNNNRLFMNCPYLVTVVRDSLSVTYQPCPQREVRNISRADL